MTTNSTRRRFLTTAGGSAVAALAITAIADAIEPPVQRARKLRDREGGASTEGEVRSKKHAIPGSPNPAYSRAVQLGQFVFVAGCVGRYEKGGEQMMDQDFESQAAQTLKNLKASVEAAGSSMEKVLKCTCFLQKQEHCAKFNEVYMKYFPDPRPASSTVV